MVPLAADPAVVVALIAAAVSLAGLVANFWLDRRRQRQALELDHEYAQRKALAGLIGRHHGRLLDSAVSWHYRMQNIYLNWEQRWLDVHGNYEHPAYYFRSTAYRFLALQAHAHQFGREQIFIDGRFAQPRDLDFVKFVGALHWVVTDTALFRGLEYDVFEGPDHVMSDRMRALTDEFLADDGVPTFRTFEERLSTGGDDGLSVALSKIFKLLDGVRPDEDRLRWDRLICLHLLTIAFIRQFGYEWTHPPRVSVEDAISRLQHSAIATNLVVWLPKLGLEGHEGLADVVELLGERGNAQ